MWKNEEALLRQRRADWHNALCALPPELELPENLKNTKESPLEI